MNPYQDKPLTKRQAARLEKLKAYLDAPVPSNDPPEERLSPKRARLAARRFAKFVGRGPDYNSRKAAKQFAAFVSKEDKVATEQLASFIGLPPSSAVRPVKMKGPKANYPATT